MGSLVIIIYFYIMGRNAVYKPKKGKAWCKSQTSEPQIP
jgi:hypothetical protein